MGHSRSPGQTRTFGQDGTTVAAPTIMSTQSAVVIGYNFSTTGHAALRRGVTMAARAPYHVLHVVCVVDPHDPLPSIPSDTGVDYRYAARVQDALAVAVQEELDLAEPLYRVSLYVHARIGKPADEILEVAREVGADLIVVGSHNLHGLERLLVGSVSETIVRDARCTVVVARPKAYLEVELLPASDVAADRPSHVPPHGYEYEDHHVVLAGTPAERC